MPGDATIPRAPAKAHHPAIPRLLRELQHVKPAIAQLVEHLTVERCSYQMVPGSIPGGRILIGCGAAPLDFCLTGVGCMCACAVKASATCARCIVTTTLHVCRCSGCSGATYQTRSGAEREEAGDGDLFHPLKVFFTPYLVFVPPLRRPGCFHPLRIFFTP